MAVFRIDKTRDYTVMSNHHLRNRSLSLKAKGLLSLMLSLPEDWDYTMKGLAHICKDGIDSISGGIRELEAHGYLIRERVRNENGQLGSIEYTILEQPKQPEPIQGTPILENPVQVNPTLDEPMQGEPAQLNTKGSSNQKSKKDLSITEPSNPIQSNPPTPAGARMGTDGMGAREAYREVIFENIGYEYLIQDSHINREQLDEIAELIVDTVCSARKTIRVAGDDYPAEVVKSRFMKLDSSHVQYVIEIAAQGDNFDHIRELYTQMLRKQLEKGNNGLVKTKYLTLTIEAKDIKTARARFSRIILDALNHFKVMGALAKELSGKEWLEVLHGILHPDGERFSFEWGWLAPSGLHDFGTPYEEWFITDYDCYVGGLYDKLGEYANLDELNYLAAKLDDMDRSKYNQFLAAMEMGEYTGSIQDIINLTENLDCYDVYPDIEDHDDLGRYYIDELEAMQVPDHLHNYIDYEAYGRDVALEEGGEFTEFGYVRDTGSRFYEVYDGDRENIPEEYRVMNFQDEDMELSESDKLDMATDLAFDLDEFFRQHDPQYAAQHLEPHEQKEVIADLLLEGKTAALRQQLEEMAQTGDDVLPSRIAEYERETGYDPEQDTSIEEDRALLVQRPEQPDDHLTGDRVQTPRGSFHLTDLSREQMEAAGYGIHHNSDDGRFHIMGNGTRAFAVVNADMQERDNPLRTAEMTIEDDYGMIDGVINNGRRDEPEKKTSIRERLEDAKRECAERKPPEVKRPGRDAQEYGDL